MRFKKIYLEITNICNLSCKFCHGTKREKRSLSLDEFKIIMEKIKGRCDYLFFHLMGEPLLHINIIDFLKISSSYNFKNIITTNGTLLPLYYKDLAKYIYKINISLHSYSWNNMDMSLKDYIHKIIVMSKYLSDNKVLVSLRLWNIREDSLYKDFNDEVFSYLKEEFDSDFIKGRTGYKLKDNIYLEYGDLFDWPDINKDKMRKTGFCYALRDQIGILSNGEVVPCCLDADGIVSLGNIFKEELDDILNSLKVKEFYDLFSNHILPNDLCKTCGYIKRFD